MYYQPAKLCTANPLDRTPRRSGKSRPATYLRRHPVSVTPITPNIEELSESASNVESLDAPPTDPRPVPAQLSAPMPKSDDPRVWVNLTRRDVPVFGFRPDRIIVNANGRGNPFRIDWRRYAGHEIHVVVASDDLTGGLSETLPLTDPEVLDELAREATISGGDDPDDRNPDVYLHVVDPTGPPLGVHLVTTLEPLVDRERRDLFIGRTVAETKERAALVSRRRQARGDELYAAEKRKTRAVVVPEFRTAAEGFALTTEPAPQAVERCLPAGGRGLLVAQYKAGKTTMVNNLLVALADGTPFLGQFRAQQRRVMILDTELTDDEANARISALPLHNPDKVARIGLEGRASEFDPRDKANRSAWAQRLREFGTEVLVLDCLAPLLRALGINESQNASEILYALSELQREAGISELFVVHHAGTNGKPRGDTGVPGWASAIWTLTVAGKTLGAPRRFSTTGWRGIDVADGRLAHDDETGALTYMDADPDRAERIAKAVETASAELETAANLVVDLVAQANEKGTEPSGRAITHAARESGLTKALAEEALRRAEGLGKVIYRNAGGNARLWRVNTTSDQAIEAAK
ncbi:AAA family ATPase [Gordonia amarae]|nr:AAA family ATPase [Gordonia amarae]QHN22455.1 AAA family ATPase [Gordonia amarae]